MFRPVQGSGAGLFRSWGFERNPMAANARPDDIRQLYLLEHEYEKALETALDAEEERRLSRILQQLRAFIIEIENRS